MRAAIVAALLTACAPVVDGPVEKQAAVDHADEMRLTTQLVALPGVAHAEVVLRRPARDPLSTATPAPIAASIVLVVDDKADRAKLETSARALTRTFAPEVDPTIVVEVGVHRADLAQVGPFTVEASSKPGLKATLAIALTLIAVLAAYIAWTTRRPRA
jgi:type III secretory pathway lipoprotein EscJ